MNDLIIENLTKRFGVVKAVDHLSLVVPAGKLITLLGPSGCGKSTTLNCIAGLERPTEGVIRIGDFAITDTSKGKILPPEQRQLGMVFQSYALWPHMTVYGNIAFTLGLRKINKSEIKQRVREVLELVGMPGYEQRYPFQLSGGQQQRVALARAVVTQPRVLLLDEPLSNLDAKVREQARVWLRELQQRLGITTVYVTHDQSEAFAMSDMVAVMSEGRLLQYAPTEVYERPATRFVAEFIGVTSFLYGELLALQGGQQATVRMKNGKNLEVSIGSEGAISTTALSELKGRTVALAIRSERVELLPVNHSHDQGNLIGAEIVSSTYLGSKWQHTVETGSGQLKVETIEPAPDNRLSLYLPPEAIILLPEEKPEAPEEVVAYA
jgi:iron(III) transport system ATP-binding protein